MPPSLILSLTFHALTYQKLPFGGGSLHSRSETASSFPGTEWLLILMRVSVMYSLSHKGSVAFTSLLFLLGSTVDSFLGRLSSSPYATSFLQCLLCSSTSLPYCKKCSAKMASVGTIFFSCL